MPHRAAGGGAPKPPGNQAENRPARAAITLVPAAAAEKPVEEQMNDDRDDALLRLLSDSLKSQTGAIVGAMDDLRAEVRALRMWTLGLAALAIVLLAGTVGVSVAVDLPGVGSVSTPAAAGAP